MRTCTITVIIRQEPDLHAALMYAMNTNTNYDGWSIMQYTEYLNSELQRIGEFLLHELDAEDG